MLPAAATTTTTTTAAAAAAAPPPRRSLRKYPTFKEQCKVTFIVDLSTSLQAECINRVGQQGGGGRRQPRLLPGRAGGGGGADGGGGGHGTGVSEESYEVRVNNSHLNSILLTAG